LREWRDVRQAIDIACKNGEVLVEEPRQGVVSALTFELRLYLTVVLKAENRPQTANFCQNLGSFKHAGCGLTMSALSTIWPYRKCTGC
jgi:hypothetical protein